MLVQLKYKNDVIPGYFIDQNGKIYDKNGVEQKQKLYSCHPYFYFKGHEVHQMMIHSFQEYKEGYEIHHKNEIKTDNRLENLYYLTRAEHNILHKLGKKHSEQTKAKIQASQNKKPVFCVQLNKVFPGVKIAARELCLPHGHISLCCKGKRKTCGGYHFKYYDVDSNKAIS